jgi:hypothetical protein
MSVQVADLACRHRRRDVRILSSVEFFRERERHNSAFNNPAEQFRVDGDLRAAVQSLPIDPHGLQQEVNVRKVFVLMHWTGPRCACG